MKKFIASIVISTILCNLSACNNTQETINNSHKQETLMNTNQMTFQEIANELEKLGKTDISEETIKNLEIFWADTPDEFAEDLYKTPLLLTSIGGGSYDYDNHTWTPSSSQLYSFDVEVFDIGQMYTLFLQGISAISNHEFEITNVVEDTSKVNFAEGTGTQIIHFDCNGHSYTYEATANGDWFDVGMLNFMNEVLSKENCSKQLYFMMDGGQECIIFLCTKDWAAQFAQVTGFELINVFPATKDF